MEVTQERCAALAADIVAMDEPARLKAIYRLAEQAVAEGRSGLFTLTAIEMRNSGQLRLADYMFAVADGLPEPDGRLLALFERAVGASAMAEPARAVGLLERLEAERPLWAYAELIYAHQLGRLGRIEAATERLERAMALDTRFAAEAADFRQFFDYFHRFPLAEAEARCRALQDFYPGRTASQVAEEVAAALQDGRSYAMIRLNDGDGAFFHLGVADEAAYSALYARNRREFLRIYFGNDARLMDPDWLDVLRELNGVIADVDCLGADIGNSLAGEYGWGSLRNVPSLFNIVRKLEEVRDHRPELAGRIALTNNWINQFLLYEGHLERLLESQARIGLVSCHAALPDALRNRFGLEEVFFHKTPGEAAVTGGVEREPLGVWHGRMKAELERETRPGVLYLVAAGLQAKIYCAIIKRAGGVALDVGSVADIWMKAPTREFVHLAKDHALA